MKIDAKKLLVSAAVAGALALNLGGVAVAQTMEEDPNLVPMQNNLFLRPELTVPVGTTVTWVNWDAELHDVVDATNFVWFSPVFGFGETWQMTFDTPGVYQYLCDLHANMLGVVTVTDGAPVAEMPIPAEPVAAPPADPYGYGY